MKRELSKKAKLSINFVSNRYKRNLVNCLLLRAFKISSSYQIIHNEFQIIIYMGVQIIWEVA